MLGKRRAVRVWITGSLLCGVLGSNACTTTHPPLVSPPHPEESVPPTAPYPLTELQAANEELAKAILALNANEYEQASRLAAQASLDAQVAEARAGTENSRLIAQDVRLNSEAVQAVAKRLAVSF